MLRNWQLYALVIVAGIVSAGLDLWEGQSPNINIIRHASAIVFCLGLLIALINLYLWRTAIGRRVFKVPVLRGTWKVYAETQHLDPSRTGTFNVYIVVRQTLSRISLRLFWDKDTISVTSRETPIVSTEGVSALAGSYRVEPHGKPREFGMFFSYADNPPDAVTLYYLTKDGEIGTILLSDRREKFCDTFVEAERLYRGVQKWYTRLWHWFWFTILPG